VNLDDILELGFKELERKPVENPLPLPENYNREVGSYAARKLDLEFTKELEEIMDKNVIYMSKKRHLVKEAIKHPLTWSVPSSTSLLGMYGVATGSMLMSTFLPFAGFTTLLFIGISSLAMTGSCFIPSKNRVYLYTKRDVEKVCKSSHEFTHFLHYSFLTSEGKGPRDLKQRYKDLKKASKKSKGIKRKYKSVLESIYNFERIEGLAMKVDNDALYDYDYKEVADFRSIEKIMRVYATLGGGWNDKSRQLFSYLEENKEHIEGLFPKSGKDLKKIKNALDRENRNHIFLREGNSETAGEEHAFGYVRTLLEMGEGRTLADIMKQGFSFNI